MTATARISASSLFAIVGLVASALAPLPACAETIKIGTLKIAAYGPLFVAEERGYFAAEGLTPELVYFNSAEPIALGIASGSLDFGVSGTSAGLFNLCGQGALRIIGGGPQEVPGFRFFVLLSSNRSYEAGLKSFKDVGGHKAAVSQIGSPPHYSFALIAEKYGIDPASIQILPLQAVPNQLSAVSGGQVDETIVNATSGLPAAQRGDLKLIGNVGDVTPWQIGVLYTATKLANEHSDTVARFLRAYRKGARDYHDALTGADGKRADGPSAPAIMAIIAKDTGQTVEQVATAIAYSDAEARLDLADIAHQVAWFKAQNMVKAAVNGDDVVDKRYAVALPQR